MSLSKEWFHQTIDRSDINIQIIGIWNNPLSSASPNLIEIYAIIDEDERLVYSHNPKSSFNRQIEEPSIDDILAKYQKKIDKIIKKVTEYSVAHLRLWKIA